MKASWQSVAKVTCVLAGAALAGPTGALLGTFAGGLLATLVPGASAFAGDVLGGLAGAAIKESGTAWAAHLAPAEKQRINHDLQRAFREALGQALYDLGGERCFPKVWRDKQRDVPAGVIYSQTPQFERLWQAKDPLADQACACLQEMERALADQRILPLDPPVDQPAADVRRYLEADTSQTVVDAFLDQVVSPFLWDYGSLRAELPSFETHLQRHLLDRTLVHLAELLKHRTPAWRAFNRLMMQDLRDQVAHVGMEQEEILTRLDTLLSQPGEQAMADWSNELADLLAATGQIEKQLSEGFDAVLGRVVEQHAEVLARFDWLIATTGRIEAKVDRVLRFLEDGRWVIEGAPSIYPAEPPAPGDPPFKGLEYFDRADSGLFFGRELLTARLVRRLHESQFLVVIGASGSGKSSVVRAGLIPALERGEPLADGAFPPVGCTRWPVHIITPTAHPLEALAASLTRDSESVTATASLIEDLARDPRSLHLAVRKSLSRSAATGSQQNEESRGRGGNRLLLVVDQFEELFTLCREEFERQAFVNNLLTAAFQTRLPDDETLVGAGSQSSASAPLASPTIVVMTLRADFYAHCAGFAELREALARQQEYIGPMSQEELRRAIEEPARFGGWEFERGLVDLILRDVGDEPGALPLLSHALLETWKHRRGRVMTLESYAEAGAVRGAIAKTAEAIFAQHLSAEQQSIARSIFLRLTELGEGTQDTRRRATLDELVSRPEDAPTVDRVIQTLADARLITTAGSIRDAGAIRGAGSIRAGERLAPEDAEGPAQGAHEELTGRESDHSGVVKPVQESGEGTVEVAHEALIREWPRLRQWLDENRAGLRVHRRLTEAALEWQRAERDDDLVYRGARLVESGEWATENPGELNKLEREFLTASRARAEQEAAQREAQRKRELEAAQKLAQAEKERAEEQSRGAARLRTRALLLAGALLVAALLAVVAVLLGAQSNQNARRAEDNASQAQAASTLAVAQQTTAEAASTLAVAQQLTAEAASTEAQRQSRISLGRELAARSSSIVERDADLGLLLAVEAVRVSESLDGSTIPEAQTALYHNLEQATFSRVLRGHTGDVWLAIFSPDGSKILTASDDGTARLWHPDGTLLAVLEGHTDKVWDASFSPDGSRIVTASWDGTARLWRGDGTLLKVLKDHTDQVWSASFSPDGSQIVTASWDGTARLWRDDGTPIAQLVGHLGPVLSASFSPDGSQIVTTGVDNTARLWRSDGTFLATLEGHTGAVLAAQFSPDGSKILTASNDDTARLWRSDGTPLTALEGHTDSVWSATFSPDGARIATASWDGTARLWTGEGTLITVLRGHTGVVYSASFSPDGSYLTTASRDLTARVWRSDGSLLTVLQGHTSFVYTANFSPDGKWIVTASEDDTARVWPTHSLYAPSLQGHTDSVMWAGFSPNGSQVVSTSRDGTARLWSADGTLVSPLKGHTDWVYSAGFSPDGSQILTASKDKTVRLWRADGTFLSMLEGHEGPVRSASFSSDGKRILTASDDQTARLWHPDGTVIATLTGHTDSVWTAQFSPDDQWILTAGADGTARLWDRNGEFVRSLLGHEGPIWSAGFSRDGSSIVTAGEDGTVRLWHTDGTPVMTITNPTGALAWADLSPDGSRILTTGQDGTVRLWNVDGAAIATLEGHTAEVATALFSPDGEWIVTASSDGTARLWAADGSFIAALEGHKSWVNWATFSPDGSRIVTASWDNTARLWDVFGDVTDMLAEAQERVGRTVTDAECQEYLHQDNCLSQ